jgi:hypothetical protein
MSAQVVLYFKSDCEASAIWQAKQINAMFAKRGHTNPVVHVVHTYQGWTVQEIGCVLPL